MWNKKVLIVTSLLVIGVGMVAFFILKKENNTPEAPAKDAHDESDDPHGGEDDSLEASRAVIDVQSAQAAGIKTELAGPAVIRELAILTGRVVLNRNTTANVKARFPGLVRKVAKNLGEQVNVGDVLARVESNDSLQLYSVLSPIKGVILSRHTNVGDVAADEPLFVIADLSDLWGEFHVFPGDAERVQVKQKVQVVSIEAGLKSDSHISSLLPLIETATQTVVARVPLDNRNGQWRAGMTVQARVVVNERQAGVAVKSSALQSLRDAEVVFTKKENTYEAHVVKLGLNDGDYVEILEGIEPGTSYVSENSFLIKADIEKSGASHDH